MVEEYNEREREEYNEKEREYFTQEAPCPQTKDVLSSKDVPEGNYIINRFATSLFRGKIRTYIFILPANEEGIPTTTEELIVYGHFIEMEIEKLGGAKELTNILSPIFCKLGIQATTPAKKKHRKCKIVYNKI